MSVRHHSLWADARLADAFDLVDAVIRDHAIAEDGLPEVRALLAEIDKTDLLLGGVLRDRMETRKPEYQGEIA